MLSLMMIRSLHRPWSIHFVQSLTKMLHGSTIFFTVHSASLPVLLLLVPP
jgi:hypothetical protein